MNFKEGQRVQLKSLGAIMTIDEIGNNEMPGQVHCVWLDKDKKQQEGWFRVIALQRVP
jgi:uncharacterized protein YodC (DUF2158 family)